MDTNKNREEQLQKALHHLMCAGKHLDAAGISTLLNAEEATKNNMALQTEEADCVILRCSDFAQMVQDMIDLGDMVDELMQMLGAKEHLARTLLGVACKLDTSAQEKQAKQNIHDRTDEILNKWSNATLTVMEH